MSDAEYVVAPREAVFWSAELFFATNVPHSAGAVDSFVKRRLRSLRSSTLS